MPVAFLIDWKVTYLPAWRERTGPDHSVFALGLLHASTRRRASPALPGPGPRSVPSPRLCAPRFLPLQRPPPPPPPCWGLRTHHVARIRPRARLSVSLPPFHLLESRHRTSPPRTMPPVREPAEGVPAPPVQRRTRPRGSGSAHLPPFCPLALFLGPDRYAAAARLLPGRPPSCVTCFLLTSSCVEPDSPRHSP